MMSMKIILNTDDNKIFNEYLTFNQIPFEKVNLYDAGLDTYGRYNLINLLAYNNPILLIISGRTFNDICSWEPSRNQLINFCNQPNKLWVWNDSDGTLDLLDSTHIESGAITWFLDAPTVNNNFINNNFKFEIFPNSFFLSQSVVSRIKGAVVEKQNCQKQFLLTTIKKSGREHRDYLWQELILRPRLLTQGHALYKTPEETWIGDMPHQHTWRCGYPSMDLYLDAWLEVVPETMYKDAWFITEKTVKPIQTKTPFLLLSTPGYLNYLKEKGFQTFDSLIDESYNQQDNIEDQAKMLVDQLEFIVNNGAEKFYHACADILEHNQQRLFEIGGGWQFHMDCFIHKKLQELGIG